MKVHLWDPETRQNMVGFISDDEMRLAPELIGQWSGNVMVTVSPGVKGVMKHQFTNISAREEAAAVVLAPFNVKPLRAGYYAVHHQRRERLYSANVGGYEVKLEINDDLCSGIDSDYISDTDIAIAYPAADYAKLNLTAIVYCDGVAESIEFLLSHTDIHDRDFGSLLGADSVTHTSIWYLGKAVPLGMVADTIGVATTGATLHGSIPVDLSGSAVGVAEASATLIP